MNLRKIILEEIEELDWIKNSEPTPQELMNQTISIEVTIEEYIQNFYGSDGFSIIVELNDGRFIDIYFHNDGLEEANICPDLKSVIMSVTAGSTGGCVEENVRSSLECLGFSAYELKEDLRDLFNKVYSIKDIFIIYF